MANKAIKKEAIPEPTVVVALEEEYGEKHWVWHTGMTAEELENYWTKEIGSMATFWLHNMEGLPGRVVSSIGVSLNFLREGAWGYFKGWTEEEINEIERPTFCEICDGVAPDNPNTIYWGSHIHMDHDSYLQKSDGTILKHSGYEEKDWPETLGGELAIERMERRSANDLD